MNDEWDNPERSGPIGGLKQRWRAWRTHRRILAEERRELRRYESEARGFQQGEIVEPVESVAPGKRRYESAETRNDDESMVSRSAASTDPDRLEDSPLNGGILAQWRASARMRREFRKERRAIEAEMRGAGKSPALPNGPAEDLAVGARRVSALEQDDETRITPGMMARAIWSDLLRLKIPQWLVAIVPSTVFAISTVLPAMMGSESAAAEHSREYARKWPGFVTSKSWDAAELCGTRVLSSGDFGIDDEFRYFDCLAQSGRTTQALRFLRSRESKVRSSDLARFRFRMAEKIASRPEIARMPGANNLILTKVRESLAGPLPEQDEMKARQMLANVAVIQGNFTLAAEILEPAASRSPFVAADLLFLKFNLANDDELARLRSDASRLLVTVETTKPGQTTSDLGNLRTRLRLLMILDREKDARALLESARNLDKDEFESARVEMDKLSLLSEGRKKPVRAEVIWTRLQPLLESEPNNPAWTRLALGLWAGAQQKAGSPLDRWVKDKLQSDSVDLVFLRQGCIATHVNGRWADSRIFYRKVLEKQPDDVSALNNLSGLLYKFPPRDMNESLRLVDRALELAPKNLVILETRAQVLARMGRLDEAREILVKTLPVLPREWNLHNTLAQIYDRMGDPANAKAHRDLLQGIAKPKDADLYANLSDFLKDKPESPMPADRR